MNLGFVRLYLKSSKFARLFVSFKGAKAFSNDLCVANLPINVEELEIVLLINTIEINANIVDSKSA